MQPIYHKSPFKINARKENVDSYCRISGNNSIPTEREYWTLCNWQPDDDGSEIMQLKKLGFLKKKQFHGVDIDKEIIEQNKIWHPDANWHCGDWLEVIGYNDFNPAMVYLDTTGFVDHSIVIRTAVGTMLLCPKKTLLIVNAMLNDPRSSRKFDPSKLIGEIGRKVPSSELKKWDQSIENYDYSSTGKTDLISYMFYKY